MCSEVADYPNSIFLFKYKGGLGGGEGGYLIDEVPVIYVPKDYI